MLIMLILLNLLIATLMPFIWTDALTITTFNMLAPVHRSMHLENHDGGTLFRESEREDWWRPRIEAVARYIAETKSSSDIIMLQEWWFDEKFMSIFDSYTSHLFDRIAERRPSGIEGKLRDDGMCCLVRKTGKLELVKSLSCLTGPQRIAQILHCRERISSSSSPNDSGMGRNIFLANSHLSFPGDKDPAINDQRQACEADTIAQALDKASHDWGRSSHIENECLQVMCGDFNSNSCGLAASLVESPPYNFVNCASATAQQMLSNIGGPVNIGVTHCNHLGEKVSVDHIFLRLAKRNERKFGLSSGGSNNDRCAALALGYLDTKGTRIINVQRDNILIEGKTVLSDHMPVTATIAWPRKNNVLKETLKSDLYVNATMPLDPLEPAWGIVQ